SKEREDAAQYTLGQTSGTLSALAAPTDRELPALSRRVAAANHWERADPQNSLPPFRPAVYIIGENGPFNKVFGPLPKADGDTSLVFFPRPVTPNAHALA